MMRASYTPSADLASATLDQIARWMRQHPERTGVYAFLAARTMERDQLCYRATFGRIVRAACSAGLTEAAALRWTYRGFAAAAAGHIEPPAALEDGGG
jgi:hypothetical protein